MTDSLRPHGLKPTRLPCPWNSPGKNTGVGCHFLLQCVKVKSLSRVRLLATPWTEAHQAPPSMGFSRLHLESRTPSWAGLWTLSYMSTYIYICVWKRHTNWKTRPLEGRAPGISVALKNTLINTLIICATKQNHTFYYAYWGMTTSPLIIVHC